MARRQLRDLGLAPHDVRRLLRRRELATLHPGVYVAHTGSPTWLQEAWGAVLSVWPAALSHESALRVVDGPGRRSHPGPVHVAVDDQRGLAGSAGVRVHRLVGLDDRVHWNTTPPRVRIEEALLDLAAEAADEFASIALLADAVQARRTTPARLLAALQRRRRLRRRAFLTGVLHDLAEGTGSVLEHGFLVRVERAHRLPRARRQVAGTGGVWRDVVYDDYGVAVELDGRLFHDSAQARARDLRRDLEAVVVGLTTVRLGWDQVFGTPCHTADRLGALFRSRGWTGRPQGCRACAD